MRLINTQILDIASREQVNTSRLCLYGTGGWWTAFDRSAYALSLIFPDLDSFIVSPPGCPFSVVGLTVSERALKRYMKKNDAFRQSADYLEFMVSSFDAAAYDAWHSRIVRGYDEIINGGIAS